MRLLANLQLVVLATTAAAFSMPSSSRNSGDSAGFFKLDRFRPNCPADISCIELYDPALVKDSDAKGVWVAVYRSNYNKPSVFVRDEFFHAMRAATSATAQEKSQQQQQQQQQQQVDTSKLSTPMALEKPVAVARLRPSVDFGGKWVLDCMRCHLKKEDLDKSCDGGSEFVEALSVCVDSLLLHHVKEHQTDSFEGSIRTKATLYSNKVLEDRGFSPVEELSKDMATHISRYDACMQSYAGRTCSTSLNPGGRDRALQLVSLLGKLDEEVEMKAKEMELKEDGQGDEDDYDPWASIKMQI